MVAEQCRAHKVSTLVVDPVLVSTSGHSLGDSEVASALKERSAASSESHLLPTLSCACPFACCHHVCLSTWMMGLGPGFSGQDGVAVLPAKIVEQ